MVKACPTADSTYLIIGNAHINFLDFYSIQNNKPTLKYKTGDHLKFSTRPVPYRLFVFPLQIAPEKDALYLLRVDKHNESLQLSAEVSNTAFFYHGIATYNIMSGLLWGAVLLLITFGLFLFLITKDFLYLYYIFYILTACFWVIADKGYGFQYLWPESTYFASRSRPVFNGLFTATLLHFMQAFIGQNRESVFYKPIKWIKIISVLLVFLFLAPVNYLQYHELVQILMMLILVIALITTALTILSIVEKIRSKNRQAWFYLFSVISLLVFGATEVLLEAGSQQVTDSYLSKFGIQTGIVIEATILIFGLAYRFNTYRKDREFLLIAINRKQEEMRISILETQENERKKIADQLHDDVGAMLSIATLQVSTALNPGGHRDERTQEKLISAQAALKNISQSIRTLSHTLTPWAIEKYGLLKAVQDLIYNVNLSDKIILESTLIGFTEPQYYPIYFLNDLYRIKQELLNNILKHADATHAYLEVIEHKENITIMIEDNGKGFLTSHSEKLTGKGLESIYAKVAYYKGQIEINSEPGHGTIIIIDLPNQKNSFNLEEL